MTNSSTPPLLRPPPADASDAEATRQWMQDMYGYCFQMTQRVNALQQAATSTSTLTPIGTISPNLTVTSANAATTTSQINAMPLSGLASVGKYLVSDSVVTNVSAISFPTCFSSAFNRYDIEIINLFSVTSAGIPTIQFTTNSGSSYDSTTLHYAMSGTVSTGGAVAPWGNGGGATGLQIASGNLGTTIITSGSGSLDLCNPNSTSGYLAVNSLFRITASSTTLSAYTGSGHYNQTGSAITGFQIVGSAGNLTGEVRVYGVI